MMPARLGRRPLIVAAAVLVFGGTVLFAQDSAPAGGPPDRPRMGRPRFGPRKKGLVTNSSAAFQGYTLYTPLNSMTTYLVDMEGREVHTWPSKYLPGQSVYLLDDGSLLRTERAPRNRHFHGGGIGGRVQRIAADGQVLWDFDYADEHHCSHHDIEPMPNGNVLLIAWEKKTRAEAEAAGRDPKRIPDDEFWPDYVIEVAPEGDSGGRIVWEWHTWDHLVQQLDQAKANYGVVAEHPERIDLNFVENVPRESPEEVRRLQGLGYVGGGDGEDDEDGKRPQRRGQSGGGAPGGGQDGRPDRPRPGRGFRGPGMGGPGMGADWLHTNSIAYNAKLDQIMLSNHNMHEIWIIDHSTTTDEARGSTGGKAGKGGDLLYRWGNPRAYGAGAPGDQQLWAQHDAEWVRDGCPGAGHITIFNNGMGREGAPYSSIVEIAPPVDAAGRYALDRGKAFGPARPVWEYMASKKSDFFASHISGAQRLPNGNTLICSGEVGQFFEVTPDGATVWEYWNPHESRDAADMGPGYFGPGGGVFRATRIAADAPGVKAILELKKKAETTGGK